MSALTGLLGLFGVLGSLCFASTATTKPAAVDVKPNKQFAYTFAKDEWNPHEWILVKSPRWDHFGTWKQNKDHIENKTPHGATPKQMLGGTLAHQTYTSMVLKKQFVKNVTLRCDMEFAHRMASLIVIASDLGKSKNGTPEYREHFEIVVYDQGINVWHHRYKKGKPSWQKRAFWKFTLKPNKRYTLEVHKKGKMLQISIDGHKFGYVEEYLPEKFHVGITGCEGVNRFYNFYVRARQH